MTVVNEKREPVTRQAVLVITFTLISDGEESVSETDLESLDEQDLWYATDDKAEYEAMFGLREKLQHATTSRRLHKKGDNNGRERVTPNRSKSIQELNKVTTSNRCGALGHWEDECPQKGTPPEIITE